MPNKRPQQSKVKALYGGAFDPPHLGHIQPLLATADTLNLQHIELLPSHVPVFKDKASTIEHRLAMTHLMANVDPRLSVNTIELRREEPSYTVDTLAQLKQQAPEQILVFIIGSDSLANLHKWHNWKDLFNYCHLVVMLRPEDALLRKATLSEDINNRGATVQSKLLNMVAKNNTLALNLYDFHTTSLLFDDLVSSRMDETSHAYLSSKLAPADGVRHNLINLGCMSNAFMDIISASATGKLWLVNNQQIAVSSTFVRMQLKQGRNVERWVPKSILNYINQHQLYH